MATSVYFNNFNQSSEQRLIEDLVLESIKIYGHDCFYLPREISAKDDLFLEDSRSQFNSAHEFEMYIGNYQGFEGSGDIFTKFNLEIRDQITFVISARRFSEEFPEKIRPSEGDLIYFPLGSDIFQITYVDHQKVFYQLGNIQMYYLKCQKMEFSNEIFNTGIEEIDNIFVSNDISTTSHIIKNEESENLESENSIPFLDEIDIFETSEKISQNDIFKEKANLIIDFDEKNPFLDGEF